MKKISFLIAVVSLATVPVFAQVNLKKKLEKKADQTIDNLLFGKKKKSSSDADVSSSGDTSPDAESIESYESDNSSDPLGGYTRGDVDYGSLSTGEVVHFKSLIDFLPNSFLLYQLSQKPEGSTMRYGEYKYSLGGKTYDNGAKEMKVSVFDYLQTGMLLGAYANQYEYESTDGIMKSVEVKGQPGWFTANYQSDETGLNLVVNNRFLVSFAGEGMSEEELKAYAITLDLERLPLAPPVEETED